MDLAGRKRPGEDPAKLLWSVACDFLRKHLGDRSSREGNSTTMDGRIVDGKVMIDEKTYPG